MSYAHQYMEQNEVSVFYSNPFDGNPQSPKIYFQPHTVILAALLKLGVDPGLCFSLFGLIMAALSIWIGLRIILHLLPAEKKVPLITTLFTWGGGLTAIAGIMGSLFLPGHQTAQWIDGIYLADPNNGWWGLNWGRTFFIPLEAYYHFLFLLGIYLILKQKWKAAAVVAFFLSISHPFTGIEYLLILNGWLLIEKLLYKNKSIPYWYWAVIFIITIFHIWYYLVYLNSFPEHKQIFSQYRTGWTYSLMIAAAAYCLVALLALLNMYLHRPAKKFFMLSHQRLFFCWAVIAFLLSKHEWFIKPIQPIHFSRGYVWAGLFLFALPALLWLINYLQQKKWKWVLYIFIFLFLSDNILWATNLLRGKNDTEWEGHITKDTKEVLDFLRMNTTSKDLLVGDVALVNYLANVYTSVNVWASHPYNTPNRDQRVLQTKQFLATWIKPPEWKNYRIIVVLKRSNLIDRKQPSAFENGSYEVIIP